MEGRREDQSQMSKQEKGNQRVDQPRTPGLLSARDEMTTLEKGVAPSCRVPRDTLGPQQSREPSQ